MFQNITQDKDYYYDENGYMVFTETYHLKKGYCCGHGCRHCPFDYESVPEPKRSILLSDKKTQKDA
ncbi:MAG: DUF5522 domain-containing protein [Chitinophagaceae bacterium]